MLTHITRKLYKGSIDLCTKVSTLRQTCRQITKTCRKRRNSSEYIPLVEIGKQRATKWSPSTIVRILAIMTVVQVIIGCQQTAVIPSSSIICNLPSKNCSNRTAIIAKLNTMQSEICLNLKYQNREVHIMKITVEELILRCRKETLYYTRNTLTQVQYRKRCPHMGTCTGLKCAKIQPDTLIEELDVANNYTGITYCSESCGGLGCSCGYPSSGCLFYRIYHVPVDNEIFEVFQCPSWFETIKLRIEQAQLNKPIQSYQIEIKPFSVKRLHDATIEITTFFFTPISLLNKRYITNKQSTAHLSDETTFSYACTSYPNKKNLTTNCAIRDSCTCNPAEDSVNCYCTHNNVSQLGQLSHVLPTPIQI